MKDIEFCDELRGAAPFIRNGQKEFKLCLVIFDGLNVNTLSYLPAALGFCPICRQIRIVREKLCKWVLNPNGHQTANALEVKVVLVLRQNVLEG